MPFLRRPVRNGVGTSPPPPAIFGGLPRRRVPPPSASTARVNLSRSEISSWRISAVSIDVTCYHRSPRAAVGTQQNRRCVRVSLVSQPSWIKRRSPSDRGWLAPSTGGTRSALRWAVVNFGTRLTNARRPGRLDVPSRIPSPLWQRSRANCVPQPGAEALPQRSPEHEGAQPGAWNRGVVPGPVL